MTQSFPSTDPEPESAWFPEVATATASETAATPPAPANPPFGHARIIATLGAIQGLTIAANLVRSKIVAVLIGPMGVGIVSVIDQVVTTVVLVSSFSLPLAGMKYLSRSVSEGREAFARTHRAFFKALLLLSCGGTALALAAAVFRPGLLGDDLAPYRAYLVVGLMAIPTVPLRGYLSNVFAALGKFRVSAMVAFLGSVLAAIAAYAGIELGGILGLYGGRLLVGVAMVAGTLWYLHRSLRLPILAGGSNIRQEIGRSPDVLRFCGAMYVTSFTGPASYLIVRLALLKHAGFGEVGLFQSAFAVASAISLVLGQAGNLYLLPAVNQNIPKADKRKKALEFLRSLCLLVAVAAMPLVLFPSQVITLLYSSSFTAASAYLFGFVVAECILVLSNVFWSLTVGLDDIKVFVSTAVLSQVSLAALAWFWAPRYGLAGVMAALLVCRLVPFLALGGALYLRHGFTMPARAAFQLAYTVIALAAVGMFFRNPSALTWFSVVSRGTVFVLFAFSIWLFLEPEEKTFVRRLVLRKLSAAGSDGNEAER